MKVNREVNKKKKLIIFTGEFTFEEVKQALDNADKYGKVLIRMPISSLNPDLTLLQASSIAKSLIDMGRNK